jgi:pyruvate/2-oxoglutarate dehydrogenase complex dihydrolipoamide acyltransferase (E2) component
MRKSASATVLFLSSFLVSGFALAQQPETAPGSNETQTTPVQPDRTPQQSDQARERERKAAEDTRVKRDWTTQRDEDRTDMDRMRQQHMRRMMEDMDHRTTGGNWRTQRDDEDMDRRSRFRDEDRPRRRVKICFEYENGDEFCRYRE